jgi:hypothetical protein
MHVPAHWTDVKLTVDFTFISDVIVALIRRSNTSIPWLILAMMLFPSSGKVQLAIVSFKRTIRCGNTKRKQPWRFVGNLGRMVRCCLVRHAAPCGSARVDGVAGARAW